MSVIASSSVTLSQTVDISAYYRYYKLQSSTSNPPDKPESITTLPPSGWSDSEPSYTEGSTNSLYFVDLIVYSDGDFEYSEVSLSSAYEAAKQAYNKAIAAQTTANTANTKIDNLEIGGRNILRATETMPICDNLGWKVPAWYKSGTGTLSYEDIDDSPIPGITKALKFTTTVANTNIGAAQGQVPLKAGTVTHSVWAKIVPYDEEENISCTLRLQPIWVNSSVAWAESGYKDFTITDAEWHRYTFTKDILYEHPSGRSNDTTTNNYACGGYVYIRSATVGDAAIIVGNQMEYGDIATSWTLAPEDVVLGGGINLLTGTESMSGFMRGSLTSLSDGVATLTGSSSNWNSRLDTEKFDIGLYDGETTYTWSFEYCSTSDMAMVSQCSACSEEVSASTLTRTKYKPWFTTAYNILPSTNGEWVKWVYNSRTIDLTDLSSGSGNATSGFLQLYARTDNATIQIRHMKLEKGTKATDWTLAPEDVSENVEEAKKVANNYISTDGTGLMVADLTNGIQSPSQATGKNVLIGSSSVDIRSGQNVLASYGTETTIGNRKALGNNYILLDSNSLELNRVTDVSNPNSIVSENIFAIGENDAEHPFYSDYYDENRVVVPQNTNGMVLNYISELAPFTQVLITVRYSASNLFSNELFTFGTSKDVTSSLDSTARIVYDGDTQFTFYGGVSRIYHITACITRKFINTPAYTLGQHITHTYPNQLIVGAYNDISDGKSREALLILADGTSVVAKNVLAVYTGGYAMLGNDYIKTFESDSLGFEIDHVRNVVQNRRTFAQYGNDISGTNGVICSGLITQNKKEVRFSYILPRNFNIGNASSDTIYNNYVETDSVTIDSLWVIMRHCGGGYVGFSTSVSSASIDMLGYIKSARIEGTNILTIALEYTDGWKTNSGTLNNNSPIAVNVRHLIISWNVGDPLA